jgi:hypothetical protein
MDTIKTNEKQNRNKSTKEEKTSTSKIESRIRKIRKSGMEEEHTN